MALVQITEMNLDSCVRFIFTQISKENLLETAQLARAVVDAGKCTTVGSLALMETFAEICESKADDMDNGRDG